MGARARPSEKSVFKLQLEINSLTQSKSNQNYSYKSYLHTNSAHYPSQSPLYLFNPSNYSTHFLYIHTPPYITFHHTHNLSLTIIHLFLPLNNCYEESMAPKRARTAGGSSSRNAPPLDYDTTKFQSKGAQEEYEKLQAKAVAKERGFRPVIGDGELPTMIMERDWWRFCDIPPAVPLGIVREFYANAKGSMNGRSWVRGRPVDYSAEAIRGIFDLAPKPDGVEDWTFKARSEVDLDQIVTVLCVPQSEWKKRQGSGEHLTFSAAHMNMYARAWNMFICSNMLPSSHSHEVTVERAILLWAILNGEYIDVGYMVHQSMLRFMRGGTTGAIPHASIVTRLCVAAGVDWGLEEQLQQPSSTIDKAAIARLTDWYGGTPHPRGLGYIMSDSGNEGFSDSTPIHPDSPNAPDSQGGDQSMGIDSVGMSAAQYRRITRRLDAMHEINRRQHEEVATEMQRILAGLNIQSNWPVFGAHRPYPPPDSPPEEGQ